MIRLKAEEIKGNSDYWVTDPFMLLWIRAFVMIFCSYGFINSWEIRKKQIKEEKNVLSKHFL